MPGDTGMTYPFPYKTGDGEENVKISNLIVTGSTQMDGSVTIEGPTLIENNVHITEDLMVDGTISTSDATSTHFTATDSTNQYRVSSGTAFDFIHLGTVNPTFNFKNSVGSTGSSNLVTDRVTTRALNASTASIETIDSSIITNQTLTSTNGTITHLTATDGDIHDITTNDIVVEQGTTPIMQLIPFENRGIIRTLDDAFGLDVSVQGAHKQIKLATNDTVRLMIDDTQVSIPTETESTDENTGALVVRGGMGVKGNVHIRDNWTFEELKFTFNNADIELMTITPLSMDLLAGDLNVTVGTITVEAGQIRTTAGNIVAGRTFGLGGTVRGYIVEGTNYVKTNNISIKSAGGLDYDFILPNSMGSSGKSLTSNGSGSSTSWEQFIKKITFNVPNYLTITGSPIENTAEGTLTLGGSTTGTGVLVLNDNPTLVGVTVSGTTTLTTLNVSGTTTLTTLTVSGSSTLTNLTVTGTTTLATLSATGTTTLTSLTCTGAATLTSLSVTGVSNLTNLTVTGTGTISSLTVTGNLSALGLSTLTNVTITGTLSVAGFTTLSGLTAGNVTCGTLQSTNLTTGTVQAGNTTCLALQSTSLVTGNVTCGALQAGNTTCLALQSTSLVTGNVTCGALQAGNTTCLTLQSTNLTTGAIQGGNVTCLALQSTSLATGDITCGAIQAGNITCAALQSTSFTTGALTAGNLTCLALQSTSVSTGTIQAGNVTCAALQSTSLATGNVTCGALQAGNTTCGTLQSTSLVTGAVTCGAMGTGLITALSVIVPVGSIITGVIGSGCFMDSGGAFKCHGIDCSALVGVGGGIACVYFAASGEIKGNDDLYTTSTIDAVSASTGALRSFGGLGVAKSVYIGETLNVLGVLGIVTTAITASSTITATRFISTVAIGTAPFTVTSTTVVPNLNVSQLLGATWAAPGAIGSTTPTTAVFTTMTTTTIQGATISDPNDSLSFGPSGTQNCFFDRNRSGGTFIFGYRTGKNTVEDPRFQVYNNATDKNLLLTVYSKGTGSGTDRVQVTCPFYSTVSTGTAPFSISSTTVVPNLNVSQLLGSTWTAPGAIGSATPNTGNFTNLYSSTLSGNSASQVGNDTLYFGPSTNGNTFLDRNRAGGTFIFGYNTAPVAGVSSRFQIYNNSTNRTLLFDVTSRGSSTGSDLISINCPVNLTGLTSITGAISSTSTITGTQLISTIATGTAPLSVTSTTVVPNLNVSQLLGSTWVSPGTIGSTTPNTGNFTSLFCSNLNGTSLTQFGNDTIYFGPVGNDNAFIDRNITGGNFIWGYNTVKASGEHQIQQWYNNLTDRNLLMYICSKGTSSGTDRVQVQAPLKVTHNNVQLANFYRSSTAAASIAVSTNATPSASVELCVANVNTEFSSSALSGDAVIRNATGGKVLLQSGTGAAAISIASSSITIATTSVNYGSSNVYFGSSNVFFGSSPYAMNYEVFSTASITLGVDSGSLGIVTITQANCQIVTLGVSLTVTLSIEGSFTSGTSWANLYVTISGFSFGSSYVQKTPAWVENMPGTNGSQSSYCRWSPNGSNPKLYLINNNSLVSSGSTSGSFKIYTTGSIIKDL